MTTSTLPPYLRKVQAGNIARARRTGTCVACGDKTQGSKLEGQKRKIAIPACPRCLNGERDGESHIATNSILLSIRGEHSGKFVLFTTT